MSHSDLTLKFVDANGIRFAYFEWGPERSRLSGTLGQPGSERSGEPAKAERPGESGPLVLAMHGFPDTPHSWNVIAPAIAAQGYRVVAPFLRGYAPSSMPKTDATALELGEDTIALISALGEQRAHLIGHDWGAECVYSAVGLAPERVLTLTAIGIPHRAGITPTPRLAWAIRHFAMLRLPGAEPRFAANDFAQLEMLTRRWSPTWKFTPEDMAPVKECFRAPGTVHASLGYYRAASIRTPKGMKSRVPVPTLNVAGADDPGVGPETYEKSRKHYTGSFEVAVIPGGHFCHRESPDQLIPRLISHLARARP